MAQKLKGILAPNQCFWGAALVYPIYDLVSQTTRDDDNRFARFLYLDRSNFKWTEKNINLFDDELIRYSEEKDDDLSGAKVIFAVHPGLHDYVHGLFSAKGGAEIDIAARILVDNVEEFRSILPETVKRLTGNSLTSQQLNLISDKELNLLILPDNAKRFIFHRCIVKASNFIYMFVDSLASVFSFMVTYPVFLFLTPKIGPIASLVVVPLLATGFFFFILRSMCNYAVDSHLDQQATELDEELLKGAYRYLEISQKFCLLMNRLAKKDRGHPFSADGNPTDTSTPFAYRLGVLKDREKANKEQARKTKKYV
ncbi:unnamed protein product [Bursaphelenchus xylophilus]|uniref:(pine wood nematode) hypothetical protein n=1 Tax=Bursaphelenchus xylophilus TaxID=6326 RepID=A0A1I7SQ08_BURXY|nr:unnamed protein product [Bursaphelenchus xylophilus]CAG9109458.1 unnamed protein product [Bursaphelenchus xylophilus]